MSRHYIVSMGTSLLTNSGWRQGNPLPDVQVLFDYLQKTEPDKASAETNSICKIDPPAGSTATFLCSHTDEGKLCADVLKNWYGKGVVIRLSGEVVPVESLGYDPTRIAEHGFRALVRKSAEIIRAKRREGIEVELAVTGGFKIQIAYLNMVALLFGCKAHYIHEQYETLMTLPPLPVAWDTFLIDSYKDFFSWIEEDIRPASEVHNRAASLPDSLQALVEYDQEYGYLSAGGVALYEAWMQQTGVQHIVLWPSPSTRPPHEKDKIEKAAHHRCKPFNRLVETLTELCVVDSIHYFEGGNEKRAHAKVSDAVQGTIEVTVYDGTQSDTVLVTTTARGKEQCEMVCKRLDRIARELCR